MPEYVSVTCPRCESGRVDCTMAPEPDGGTMPVTGMTSTCGCWEGVLAGLWSYCDAVDALALAAWRRLHLGEPK